MTDNSAWKTANPFALLVAPEGALAAAKRLSALALNRNIQRMDGRTERPQDPELAKFDEAVEQDNFDGQDSGAPPWR